MEIRRSRKQLTIALAAGWVGLVGSYLVFALLRWMFLHPAHPLDPVVFGVLQATALTGWYLVILGAEHLHLDPFGITIVRPLRRPRFTPWAQVVGIDVRDGPLVRSVVLRNHWGPTFLPLPACGRLLPNPAFDAEVAAIIHWWRHYRLTVPDLPAQAPTRRVERGARATRRR